MNTKNLDHLLFLEEVESEQSLAWATEQTKRAKNDLQKDSRFNFAYENILNVYQDKNRLKVGVIHRSYYYNFWQDENNPIGLWRRIKLANFNSGAWENLLDFDQLLLDTGESLTYSSFEPHPDQSNEHLVMLSLSVGGKDACVIREFELGKKVFLNKVNAKILSSR